MKRFKGTSRIKSMGMKNVRRKEYHKEYGNEECEKEGVS